MPPENTNPVAKSETSEFEFDAAPAQNPRIRKRSLKGKAAAETSPVSPAHLAPAARPALAESRPAVYAQPAASRPALAAQGPRAVYVRPGTGTPNGETPPDSSGVLYYSNGPQKEAPMKTTPMSQAARPASTTPPQRSAAAASAAQAPINRPAQPASFGGHTTSGNSARPGGISAPAASGTPSSPTRAVAVSGPAAASKPAGLSDYRNNIDRQAREQRSIGGILNLIVYGLIALFVVGAALAAYGAHDVYRQLHSQSVTVSDLDTRYSAANQQLGAQIKAQDQTEAQLQAQLAHAQELAVRQQETIAKLQSALDAQSDALREERSTRAAETSIRASETSALRNRIRALEKTQITYRP